MGATTDNSQATETLVQLKKKDFETDQDVRWCPGCGDYSILAAVQRLLPSLNLPREKIVFVSGIGCSSRFPYYMNTYGFHTIHGRAPAFATGIKAANSGLSVWMVTGDGDGLSIGGNHLLHLIRRNVNINVLLFNNRIYGLTKGQYSPTSEVGKVTKSTPQGSVDHPVNPLLFALGSRASFVARSLDVDAKHLTETLREAHEHQGCSFIEIYQNCNIFNDNAFTYMSDRKVRDDAQVHLDDGELMIFGQNKDKGISFATDTEGRATLKIVNFEAGNQEAAKKAGVSVYKRSDVVLATALARAKFPEVPVPMGVLYQSKRSTFDSSMDNMLSEEKKKKPLSENIDENLSKLYASGDTWVVN